MGRKCCVTNCYGNSDNDSKEKDFHFSKNKKEREKSLKIILRDNTTDSKYTIVAKNIGQKVMRLCSAAPR